MIMQHSMKTGFERWQEGIDKAAQDDLWNYWDGGGDPNYARKLDYVLPLLRKGKVAVCEKYFSER